MKMSTMKVARGLVTIGLGLVLSCTGAVGQEATSAKKAESPTGPVQVQTFYLNSVTQVSDATEILQAVRNMLDPHVRIILVASENAITISAPADQIALAQRLLKELDRPKKTFRLVYTVTETDGGKRIGVQHFAMALASGGRTVLKQGSRVPVATGSTEGGTGPTKMQVQYLDVGLNIDASLDGYADGVRLRTKVEQSSVAEERSGLGMQDPVIRQTLLEGTSILTQGKPMVLGSVDVSGSTRHLDVEVVLEPVP